MSVMMSFLRSLIYIAAASCAARVMRAGSAHKSLQSITMHDRQHPMLLQCRLGRRILRPLLRSEVGEVANRRAWFDVTKLTPEVLHLYKQPLKVQGWDLALLEVSSGHHVVSLARVAVMLCESCKWQHLLHCCVKTLLIATRHTLHARLLLTVCFGITLWFCILQ